LFGDAGLIEGKKLHVCGPLVSTRAGVNRCGGVLVHLVGFLVMIAVG